MSIAFSEPMVTVEQDINAVEVEFACGQNDGPWFMVANFDLTPEVALKMGRDLIAAAQKLGAS